MCIPSRCLTCLNRFRIVHLAGMRDRHFSWWYFCHVPNPMSSKNPKYLMKSQTPPKPPPSTKAAKKSHKKIIKNWLLSFLQHSIFKQQITSSLYVYITSFPFLRQFLWSHLFCQKNFSCIWDSIFLVRSVYFVRYCWGWWGGLGFYQRTLHIFNWNFWS